MDLTPLADPALVPDHVAAALDVRPGPGLSAREALVAALGARKLLLVLDNCEHLVEGCAALVATLLSGCRSLSVLTTSREPLGIPGESLWLVPPLSLPPAGIRPTAAAIAGSEAVQFFAERARLAGPAFHVTDQNAAAVAAICRRLDGLPLALELAAARTRVLTVEQLSARLDDAFTLLTQGGRTSLPRQKTLRGTIDWSFSLLAERERVLLARLAVFTGSFTLGAVEAICPGGRLATAETLDATAALVDRSLVVLEPTGGEARYRLLETVRQYALERLRSAGEEEALRERHAEHYTALAEHFAPRLFAGPHPPALLLEVDLEHDNFRAAGDWALASSQRAEVALRLAAALFWYWFARGLLSEALGRMEGALAQAPQSSPPLRAKVQSGLGVILYALGRPLEALAGLREAVAALRQAGDTFWLSFALSQMAGISLLVDPAASDRAITEAVELMATLPASALTGFVLYWEGRIAQALGQWARAREGLERSLAHGYAIAHPTTVGHALHALAQLEREEGHAEVARQLLARGLAVHDQIGDRYGVWQDLRLVALVCGDLGEARLAAQLAAAGQERALEIGSTEMAADASDTSELCRSLRQALGEVAFEEAWREGRELGVPDLLTLLTAGPDAAPLCPPAPALTAAPAAAAAARLTVAALGPLTIQVSAAEPSSGAWSSARTRELLVFLLLHPEGASKEEIGLALWPEASATQVRNSFHVTLHRLRAALGQAEWVSTESGRYRLDPALGVTFDVPRFEAQARASLAALRSRPEALTSLLEALGLYRGELLAGEAAGEWHLPLRERLQRLFLEGLAAAADTLEASDEPARAATLYRRWIAADDLAEHAYRRLMVCLERSGERAEALRLYKRLVTVLERELDVAPEPETVAIFERLQQAKPGL